MMDRIHNLPNLLVMAGLVLLFAGLTFAAPFVGRRFIHRDQQAGAALFDGFLAVMAMAGVVLAFSLVQAEANLRSDEAHLGREAALIVALDRDLARLQVPSANVARPLLADFVRNQVAVEWPRMADQGRSAATDQRFDLLSRTVSGIEPQNPRQEIVYAGLLKTLDELADARELLIEDAALHLPAIFWIVGACLPLLGLGLAFVSEASIVRAAAFAIVAGGVGLLFSFVLVMDRPFDGDDGLKPAPLQSALARTAR